MGFALCHLLVGRVRRVGQAGHFQDMNCRRRRIRADCEQYLPFRLDLHKGLASSIAIGYCLPLAVCKLRSSALCTRFALHLSKREVLKAVFDCIRTAEVLLFAMFSVEELGTDCRRSNQPEMT